MFALLKLHLLNVVDLPFPVNIFRRKGFEDNIF